MRCSTEPVCIPRRLRTRATISDQPEPYSRRTAERMPTCRAAEGAARQRNSAAAFIVRIGQFSSVYLMLSGCLRIHCTVSLTPSSTS